MSTDTGYEDHDERTVAALYALLHPRLFAVLLVLLAFMAPGLAQTPEPGAREITLTLPDGGGVYAQGNTITYRAATVDAIVRAQSLDYLQAVVRSMLPQPKDFAVGRIEGGPGPAIPAYIAGRVAETATRVQFRVDGAGPYYEASTIRPTLPGYPKVWTWVIPEQYQDGKPHRVYARALRSSGTVIGPLDNAKSSAQWQFTIGAAPGPVEPPVVPVDIKVGRVTYAGGAVTVEVAAHIVRVELLIDGRTSVPWYYGSRKVVDGRAAFVLKPEALDGNEHALDVRLYTEAMDRPHRPDNYPVRAVLTP